MHMQCSRHITKKCCEQINHLIVRTFLFRAKRGHVRASAHIRVADHTTSVADTVNRPFRPALHAHPIKANKSKMSFEPKTKVELDPPKDDIISLDYLSKCDGELNFDSYISTTACLNVQRTGSNPDYPTYVAIKGTVFDVTGNKAYGPEGSYKGMSACDVHHSPWSCKLTVLPA